MSRRPRLRTFAARASLTMLVALVVVWAASAWVRITLSATSTEAISLRFGQVWLIRANRFSIDDIPALEVAPWSQPMLILQFWHDPGPLHSITGAPLWPFAAPLALATALLWRSEFAARRRDHPSRCPRCGYDNAATPTNSPCPECGSPAPHTPATTTHSAPPTA